MASSSNDASQDERPCPHIKDSASFFRIGNCRQFDHVLQLYPQALRVKAEKRSKKPDKLIRLDDWFQNELPKLIKKRGKDAHLNHEELVQCMEWKQSRGKNYPQLSYLIKVNTPRAVMMETRKAFKKLPNIEQAIIALSNLKGVGTTMASALLAAASPERAPFMAEECLIAIPEIEGIDYTTKEYLNFVQHIQSTVNRLNSEHALAQQAAAAAAAEAQNNGASAGEESSEEAAEEQKKKAALVEGSEDAEPETTKPTDDEDEDKKNSTDDDESSDSRKKADTNGKGASGKKAVVEETEPLKWSPHTVELALWTHYIASELKPELLKDLPGSETSNQSTVLSSKFQQNGAIDQDEETIPDGADALTSNRVTALIADNKELEEGSSSHDEGAQEVMKLNGDDLTDAVSVPVVGEDVAAAVAAPTAGNGAVAQPVENGENSSDTGTGTMTTMVNNVSSSESKAGDDEEEEGSSQDEQAFKYKTATAEATATTTSTGNNNGDISSSTSPSSTPGGTKRFNAEPLANVMAKCPKLMLDR